MAGGTCMHPMADSVLDMQATITWPMVGMFIRLCPICKSRSKNGAVGGNGRASTEDEPPTYRAPPPPPGLPVIKR